MWVNSKKSIEEDYWLVRFLESNGLIIQGDNFGFYVNGKYLFCVFFDFVDDYVRE